VEDEDGVLLEGIEDAPERRVVERIGEADALDA
jgi:hypothetical protein